MKIFENTVTLRGFLGRDVEVPPSEGITDRAYELLLLGTTSGTWDVATNQWSPRTDWHRIICQGAWFCGFTRGMRRGDYLEIEGELRAQDQERTVVVAGERFSVSRGSYAVHAIRIQRLERPLVVVDTGEDG